MAQCTKCNSGVKYREGTKGDRAWKGYFCLNQDCKNVDWIRDDKPKVNNDIDTVLLKRIAEGIEEIVSILEKKKDKPQAQDEEVPF